MSRLNLEPLSAKDIPDPQSDAFQTFLDGYFTRGEEIVESMSDWPKKTTKVNGTVQIVDLPSGSKEYWCGRISTHKQSDDGSSLYEQFRQGLLYDHSKHEQEYIEAMSEAEQLEVYRPQEAEVWRLTFITPAPTNPRTFVVLLLCREIATTGKRRFMNVSIPFSHPKCPEKVGSEKKRVRGKYVSVECVKESDKGVEWLMATSSDAGGNIPRFMTNSSLPSSIAEDVPSFLQWLRKRSS